MAWLAPVSPVLAQHKEESPRHRVHLGVERLFGVSLYSHQTKTETDFGDFVTTNQGVALHLFGASAARGDGQDGKNLSAMPRLYLDYEWASGWSLGGMLGGTYSTGRRRVRSDDTDLDPFEYPSQVDAVFGLRVGRFLPLSRLATFSLLAGPGVSYESFWGGGANASVFALQVNAQAAFSVRPTRHSRLFLAPYADISLLGITRERLHVAGVPESVVQGTTTRYGLGIAGGAGWVF